MYLVCIYIVKLTGLVKVLSIIKYGYIRKIMLEPI